MTKRELGDFLGRLEGRMVDAERKREAAEKRRDYESQLAWAGSADAYRWSFDILLKKYEKMR